MTEWGLYEWEHAQFGTQLKIFSPIFVISASRRRHNKPRDHGYTSLAIWETRRGFRRGHECVCRRDPRDAVFEDIIAGIAKTSATDEAPLIFGDICVRNAANDQTIWRDETTKW